VAQDLVASEIQVVEVAFRLEPSSPALVTRFAGAQVLVKVALTKAEKGSDSFVVEASKLQPNTGFTVFLLEKAGRPFGASEYIEDFTTDQYGNASNTYQLIVDEAFAFNKETGFRKDLNSVGMWFAEETSDDSCVCANSPVTGFDGDGKAGVQMLNSGAALRP
jgi:hypothetical protein